MLRLYPLPQQRARLPKEPRRSVSKPHIIRDLYGLLAAATSGTAATIPGAAKWRVHRGHVESSLDDGATWNDVAIAKAITFRAVSAVGNQVWAGGSGATLYHSADGGTTWGLQWSYARDAVAKAPYRYPDVAAAITKIHFDGVYGSIWVKVGGSAPQEILFNSNDGGQNWLEETID